MPSRQTANATRTPPNTGRQRGTEFQKPRDIAPPDGMTDGLDSEGMTGDSMNGVAAPAISSQRDEPEDDNQRASAFTSRGDATAEGDRIAELAYEIYLSRGSDDGDALSDWLE